MCLIFSFLLRRGALTECRRLRKMLFEKFHDFDFAICKCCEFAQCVFISFFSSSFISLLSSVVREVILRLCVSIYIYVAAAVQLARQRALVLQKCETAN